MKKEEFERKNKYDSLYSFIKSGYKSLKNERFFPYNKEELREIFLLVSKRNYEAFKDFYECHTVMLKGGNFVSESVKN